MLYTKSEACAVDAISDGITLDFSNPTIFFCPNSDSQYAIIEPTIPPTPTITTSASDGNFEFVFSVMLKFNSNFLFCKLEFLIQKNQIFNVFLQLYEMYI